MLQCSNDYHNHMEITITWRKKVKLENLRCVIVLADNDADVVAYKFLKKKSFNTKKKKAVISKIK